MNNIEVTYQELKSRLNKVTNIKDDSFQACCPSHRDSTPSLTVTKESDKILLYCHAGCETESIVEALGITVNDLFLKNSPSSTLGLKPNETIYRYYDENGVYLFEKVRTLNIKGAFRFVDENNNYIWGRTKGVYYETYPGSKHYSKKTKGEKGEDRTSNNKIELNASIPNVLYRLPEVIEAVKNQRDIFILEGEKDVDNARLWGLAATCNPDGAGRGKFKKNYAKHLINANVIIVPDNDKAGEDQVQTIVENLKGQVNSLKIVKLPGESKGFDFSDYVEAGHTKDDFMKLVEESAFIDMDKKTNPTDESGVFEAYGCYCKYTSNGIKTITNFIITLIEEINHPGGTLVTADFTNDRGITERKVFELKDFGNKRKFLEIIDSFNFSFTGSETDLQIMKNLMAQQSREKITGVSHIGFHEVEGKRYYVTNTGALDRELNEVENIVYVDKGRTIIKTEILEAEPITAEELKILAPHLFNFNSLENTASILGTAVSHFLKPLLFNEGISVSHLLIYGQSGAGKTETLRTIILPLFSTDSTINAQNVTSFSLLSNTAGTDSIPLVIDEYKPGLMQQRQNGLISEVLRNTYDNASGTRGTKTLELEEYKQISPIILVGEEGQSETATIERSCIVQLSKAKTREPKHSDSFNTLKRNKTLLNKLGRSILNEVLKIDINELMATRNEIYKNIKGVISENRVENTAINTILGLSIIDKVFQTNNLKFNDEIGIRTMDLIEAVVGNCKNEVLEGGEGTKSAIDRTLETMNRVAGNHIYTKGTDYTLVNNNTELALDINIMFDEMTRYIKNYGVEDYHLKKQTDFTKQLRNQEYFIAYKTATFGNSVRKKAYVLDIEKLLEMNVEISGFLK